MLGSARAASSSFWNGRSVGLCHEQWHNHRILTGIVARIVKISGTGSHSALCCQHSACQLLCQPTFFFFLLLFFFFESCTPRPGDRAIGPGKRLRRRARREPRAPVRDPQLRISTRGGKDTGSPQVYFLAQSLKSIPCARGSWVDQSSVLVCRRIQAFYASLPDSRPPPVSFSPPHAPPISAPLVPILILAMPQSLPRWLRNVSGRNQVRGEHSRREALRPWNPSWRSSREEPDSSCTRRAASRREPRPKSTASPLRRASS